MFGRGRSFERRGFVGGVPDGKGLFGLLFSSLGVLFEEGVALFDDLVDEGGEGIGSGGALDLVLNAQEILFEFMGVLVAFVGLKGEGFHDDLFKDGRKVREHGVEAWEVAALDLGEQSLVGLSFEHFLEGEDLVEHDADLEEVGALVEGVASGLFGGHIGEFALEFTDGGFGEVL